MANYNGILGTPLVAEQYRAMTPLAGFYYGKAKLIGSSIQVGPGGSFHVYAALDVGQSVSCRSFVPVDGDTMLEVRSLAGETIDKAYSSGSGDWEDLAAGPLTGIEKGIYIVRLVNLTSGARFGDARAYFKDLEVV